MEGLGEPLFDGVAEFGFDDMDMFQKWFAWFMSDGGQPLRDDEKNFMDSSSAVVVMVEERVIIPGDDGEGRDQADRRGEEEERLDPGGLQELLA